MTKRDKNGSAGWISRLVKILGYVFFLALFLELSLQGFYYFSAGAPLYRRTALAMFRPDPVCGWFNKPGLRLEHKTHEFKALYQTNDQGMRALSRDAVLSPRKGEDVFRILLLGPSFAFGWGVDYADSYAARLQGFLSEARELEGKRVEVVNAGVPSLPPANNLAWFKARGADYSPDLAVQFIYGAPEVSPRLDDHQVVTKEGFLSAKGLSWRSEMIRRLKKFAIVFYGWTLKQRLQAAWSKDREESRVQGAGREMKVSRDFDPESSGVRSSLKYYAEFSRAMAESGVKPLIVYIPLSYCVHPEDFSRWSHLGAIEPEAQNRFTQEFLAHMGEQTGLDRLDVTPDLVRKAKEGERLYYWLDIHWTPLGNEVAAKATAERILKNF